MALFDPATPGPFYHGTKAVFARGALIAPGFRSNFVDRALNHVYFAALLEPAIWGAELARSPDGNEGGLGHVYLVEPTGVFEDDPNLTDKKFPGNPTRSYRSTAPLRVLAEIEGWLGHPAEQLQTMREGLAQLEAAGKAVIID